MMLNLIALSLVVAFCSGTTISSQYHSQDGFGGYTYGHSGGPSTKTEYGSASGLVSGSYSYLDGSGIVQTATYTADPIHGFRVHASNLPVPPQAPLAVLSHSYLAVPVYRPLGVPVADTPEVAAAKAEHLAAVEHQKAVIASHYRRRRAANPGFSYHSVTTHIPVYHYPYNYPFAIQSDIIPKAVTDTPEVTAAKFAHFSAVKNAKLTLGVH